MRSYDRTAEQLFKPSEARTLGRGIAITSIIAYGEIVATLAEHSDAIKKGRVAEHMMSILTPFERFMAGPPVPRTKPATGVNNRHDKAGVTDELKHYVIVMLGGAYLLAAFKNMRMEFTPEVKAEYMKRLQQYATTYDTPVGNLPKTTDELVTAFTAQQVRIPVITPGLRELSLAVLRSDTFLREAPGTNPSTLLSDVVGYLDHKVAAAM